MFIGLVVLLPEVFVYSKILIVFPPPPLPPSHPEGQS